MHPQPPAKPDLDQVRPAPSASAEVVSASTEEVLAGVPRSLRVAAAVGWRLLVVAAAVYVIAVVVEHLAAVVVPVAIALLLAALLAPAVGQLNERGVPRAAATAVVVAGGLAGLGGLLTFVVMTFTNGLPALTGQISTSINAVTGLLTTHWPHLSPRQLNAVRENLLASLNSNQADLTASALTTAATIGETLTQFLLVVFTLIFLLHDGRGIWVYLITGAPSRVRDRVDIAGRRALAALVAYVRATAAVAVTDAVAIGVGLSILGVPLAIPLATLVFIGAFVPIIGAVFAGGVAVLVALVAHGVVPALVTLGIVVAVMQLESHVLQPLLLGRAVKLHPLSVVLAIAAGLLIAGIAGALLAVPLLAVVNSATRSLLSDSDAYVDPEIVEPDEPEESGPDEPGLDTHADAGV